MAEKVILDKGYLFDEIANIYDLVDDGCKTTALSKLADLQSYCADNDIEPDLKVDLMWKGIAEKYIPDDVTGVLFKEVNGKKVIVIVDYDNHGDDNISLYSGDTWEESFQNSGFYGGMLDQDDDYFEFMFDEDEIYIIKKAQCR